VGTRSPYGLFDREVATYGEGAKAWSGADAAGFAKIYGIPSMLAAARDRRAAK
jgi:argininosuccinate synthase